MKPRHTKRLSARQLLWAYGLLAAIGCVVTVGMLVLAKRHDTSTNEPGKLLRGRITQKQLSCTLETLQPDGSVQSSPGVCDGGNGLTVGKQYVSTGGGGLTAGPPERVNDISSLNPGDYVEVRYIVDQFHRLSTNCAACYVKEIGASQPAGAAVDHLPRQ